MMRNNIIFIIASACCVLAFSNAADPVVRISNGFVKGAQRQTIGTGMTYYSFSGMPYAKPPVGNLRFAVPQPAENWSGERNASVECPACMQFNINGFNVVGEEDCLCVNVYTPKLPENGINPSRSVMVFIHGGGFQLGSGSYVEYGPDKLVEKNLVIVAFNYRLGCLGFLSTEDEISPGNYGLKDQVMLLRWVQTNIANFGGNPNRVTLFGQSAGSTSVAYLAQMQSAQGLFHRAILQSGSTLNTFGFARQALQTARSVAIANLVNPFNSSTIVSGLRSVDAQQFTMRSGGLVTIQSFWEQLRSDFKCVPTIEAPSSQSVVTEPSYKILNEGRVMDIPYMIGHTSLEGYFFRDLCPVIMTNEFDYARYTPSDANVDSRIQRWQLGAQIRNYYFGFLQVFGCDIRAQRYISDELLTRGIVKHIQLLANRRMIYMYKFSYVGQLGQDLVSADGAGHAAEIPYLFRTARDASPGASQQDKMVTEMMTQMWANFADTGNPAPNMVENMPVQPAAAQNVFNFIEIGNTMAVKSEFNDMMRFWNYIYSFGTLVDTM